MLEVLIATAAAFVLGGVYYAAFGGRLGGDGEMPPWKFAVEILRCLVLAAVVAWLATEAGIDDVAGGLVLGLVLFAGFPLVLWVGAVVHENTPVERAVIHGGDWLAKLLVVSVVVSL